jgi:DNA-binding response OmpR family regulator
MSPDRSPLTTVLVADPDPASFQLAQRALASEGCALEAVTTSHALYLSLLQRPRQILLLSPRLPQEGGIAVVRQLRLIRATAACGIIMLATPGSPTAIEALVAGADACIAAPLDPNELRAYVRTLARRLRLEHEHEAGALWQYHHSQWKLVSPSGVDIVLSHLESAFVYMIARQAGRPVKRRDIISQAFGQDPLHYDNRRLEALVSRLRKKVHRSYPLSQPIKVVHSIGYVFTDAIKCIENHRIEGKGFP